MLVITHKMVYRKAPGDTCFGPKLVDLGLHAVLTQKGRSLIVKHLFGVQIVRICRILSELCLMKKKEERKKKKNNNKIENFTFDFLD